MKNILIMMMLTASFYAYAGGDTTPPEPFVETVICVDTFQNGYYSFVGNYSAWQVSTQEALQNPREALAGPTADSPIGKDIGWGCRRFKVNLEEDFTIMIQSVTDLPEGVDLNAIAFQSIDFGPWNLVSGYGLVFRRDADDVVDAYKDRDYKDVDAYLVFTNSPTKWTVAIPVEDENGIINRFLSLMDD